MWTQPRPPRMTRNEFHQQAQEGSAPTKHQVPSGRRVVQPQIISDNSSRVLGGQEEVTGTRVGKSVEPQVLGSKAEESGDSPSGSDDSSSDDSSDDSRSSHDDDEDEPVQYFRTEGRGSCGGQGGGGSCRKLENQSKEKKARQQRVGRSQARLWLVQKLRRTEWPRMMRPTTPTTVTSRAMEDVKAWKERELARLARDDKD